jgi:light-harvesting complex 1 beta chain
MTDPSAGGSASGLTPEEAREFHGVFMSSFMIFVVVAIVAHVLAWLWRPWLPGERGYTSLMDGVTVAQTYLTTLIG